MVEALVAAGADLEAPSDAGTPLLWAAGSGAADVVAALLAAGAAPDALAEGHVSAVFMATASGDDGCILSGDTRTFYHSEWWVATLCRFAPSSQSGMRAYDQALRLCSLFTVHSSIMKHLSAGTRTNTLALEAAPGKT